MFSPDPYFMTPISLRYLVPYDDPVATAYPAAVQPPGGPPPVERGQQWKGVNRRVSRLGMNRAVEKPITPGPEGQEAKGQAPETRQVYTSPARRFCLATKCSSPSKVIFWTG